MWGTALPPLRYASPPAPTLVVSVHSALAYIRAAFACSVRLVCLLLDDCGAGACRDDEEEGAHKAGTASRFTRGRGWLGYRRQVGHNSAVAFVQVALFDLLHDCGRCSSDDDEVLMRHLWDD